MADCLFCKIVAKELDSEIVMETDGVLAFRDINPGAPTHVLVIPKEHIPSAHDIRPEHGDLLAEMFGVMAEVADEANLGKGHRLVTNIGPEAGQTVQHLHFHVLGGRPMSWPPG
jgi:histidine triad (HIT) family protein